MDYVAALIALVAAVVGIVGGTWDPTAKGIRRVTPTGWAVLVLASSACVVQIVQTRNKNVELRAAELTRQRLASLAVTQLNQALVYTEDVFALLYTFYRHRTNQEHQGLDWDDAKFVSFLDDLDLNSSDTDRMLVDGETWGYYISRQLGRTHSRLTSTLTIYGQYLDSETVADVESLRTCELFQHFPDYNLFYRPPGGTPTLGGSHHSGSFPTRTLREFTKAYGALRKRVAMPTHNLSPMRIGR